MISRLWSPEEDATLAALYGTHTNAAIGALIGRSEPAVLNRARKLGIYKPASYRNPSHFEKGMVPHNKGAGFNAGGRSAETQFKPRQRQGRALDLYVPIGTERVSDDGYLQIKINDDLPMHRRWRGSHIVAWEAINGPLPAGHALVFLDGDKHNTAVDNLELVTRAELMRRNSWQNNNPQIAALIQLRGVISRQINKRSNAA